MKEIKIMGRADFAGDVALWIFSLSHMHIYLSVYIYICQHYHYHCGPLFDYSLSRVSTSRATVGRLYLRVVRDTPPGLSLPDSPVVRR